MSFRRAARVRLVLVLLLLLLLSLVGGVSEVVADGLEVSRFVIHLGLAPFGAIGRHIPYLDGRPMVSPAGDDGTGRN